MTMSNREKTVGLGDVFGLNKKAAELEAYNKVKGQPLSKGPMIISDELKGKFAQFDADLSLAKHTGQMIIEADLEVIKHRVPSFDETKDTHITYDGKIVCPTGYAEKVLTEFKKTPNDSILDANKWKVEGRT